jgi:undecaprenyl pyrophosphate phosphatase UppP
MLDFLLEIFDLCFNLFVDESINEIIEKRKKKRNFILLSFSCIIVTCIITLVTICTYNKINIVITFSLVIVDLIILILWCIVAYKRNRKNRSVKSF